jgi:tripartite-type tricarboxylate transporter receptor subunit TctC
MLIHRILGSLACLATLAATAPGVMAQAAPYPQRPIRVVVPFPAGGPTDILARVVGQKLSERLGQAVVVDNKPGANTIIGADTVAKAAPDGYNLLLAIDSTLVMNQSLYSKLPYDPVKDFEPIAKMAISPLVVVAASNGPRSLKEVMTQAKAEPGKLSFGYGTVTTQLGGEIFKNALGLNILSVAYKGSAGTVQGLLSNDVSYIIDGVSAALPHIQSGKFRALATLGSKPIPVLPGLPTVAGEAGLPGFDVAVWMGLVAPRGTPDSITRLLAGEVARALELPDVREKLEAVGLLPDMVSGPAFTSFMQAETVKWQKAITQAEIKIQ